MSPEDRAKAALRQDHLAAYQAWQRQQWGLSEQKQELPKQLTEHQMQLAKLLADPKEAERAMNLIDPYGSKRLQMRRRR